MILDKGILGASQIAAIAETDILNVHTWTTRGFADPYAKPRIRRGRGRARSYSVRDALRFFLMARLHEQYRTPLPRGFEICELVFAAENFDCGKAAYLVLEQSSSGAIDVQWCPDLNAVAQRLEVEALATVINVKYIFQR